MTLVAVCFVIPQRMPLSGTVVEIWSFEDLPRRLYQKQRSIVGRSVGRSTVGTQYYIDLIYSCSLR